MVKQGNTKDAVMSIPEMWEIKKLKDVAPLQRGFDLPYSQMKTGIYPVVFSNGIGAYHSEYMIPGPGVVTGRSGTIGKVHFVQKNYWPHNTSLWVTDFHGNHEKYIYYLFKRINWNAFNSGSGVPTLNRNDVHETEIMLPPLVEQISIAAALSDIDDLITNLEKLIAKKKAIKQGAMQELLTGKRRLEGYTEKWDKVKLGECCSFLGGGTPSKANHEWWNGTIPWISSSDISANDVNRILISRFISQDALEHSATKLCPTDSVLIVSRVGVGKVAVNSCELCTSQDFTILVPRLHDAHYLADCLLPIMQEKANQAQGTSIKGITTDDISEIEVFQPKMDEQKAIASVLSDMGMDIQKFEQKLSKYCLIRQGMMSELLTGRIRLIDKEDA